MSCSAELSMKKNYNLRVWTCLITWLLKWMGEVKTAMFKIWYKNFLNFISGI